MALAFESDGWLVLGADLGGTPSRQLRSVNGLVSDSATTDVILKMKRFPCYFLPFPLLRRNRPLLFFSRKFARNPYENRHLLIMSIP